MPRNTNDRIIKNYLILCEGRDAQEFLIAYIHSDALKSDPRFENNIQVMDYGGIDDLTNRLGIIMKMSGFSSVHHLAILRDAETDAAAAISSIQSSLRRNSLPVPDHSNEWKKHEISIGFSLFPSFDSTTDGTLEDLCLSIVAEERWDLFQNSIINYLHTVKDTFGKELPREFKNVLHTYFSSTNDFVSLKIGEAAKAGAFNWNHEALTSLRDFLAKGFD